ncbi:MAG: hypothetical protein AB1Z98_38030 [Nannocystaceae bacterium]
MSAAVVSSIVDPGALGPTEQEALIDELYGVQQEIFDGVSRETFAGYVVRSSAQRTRIQVFRADGRVVGYAALHVFDCEVGGRACVAVRCEVGLRREIRGGSRFGWLFAREAARLLLSSRGRPIYGLSCATSPATYRILTRSAHRVWPHWSRPTPASLAVLMDELATRFELRPVDPSRPGVYHVGWKTRETAREVARWRACEHPASRFYLGRNPGYREGHGLLLLVPMRPVDVLLGVAGLARHRLGRATKLALGAARTTMTTETSR